MTDSSSFTSLLALVDSHLSKTSLKENSDENDGNPGPFPFPSFNGLQKGMSDTTLPSPTIRLPQFIRKETPITSILAQQLSNTFKARERKRQEEEEKQRLEEKMKEIKLEEENDDCVIDLMKALQTPCNPPPVKKATSPETLSSSSSFESLLFEKTKGFHDLVGSPKDTTGGKPEDPILPCTTDLSYIIHQKPRLGKCSAFGKVLAAKVRPVAAPYLRDRTVSNIVRFDFKTKSPDDLIKEKLRQPFVSKRYNAVEHMEEILGYSFTE